MGVLWRAGGQRSLIGLLLLLTACQRGCSGDEPAAAQPPSPTKIGGIKITDLTNEGERPAGLPVRSAEIEAWVQAGLGARVASSDEERDRAVSLSVALLYGMVTPDDELIVTPQEGAQLTCGVKCTVLIAPPGEVPLRVEGEAIVDQRLMSDDPAAFEAAARELLARAVRQAVRRLARRLDLLEGPDAALIAALGDADAAVASTAAQLAGERGVQDAVPRLVTLLERPDLTLRMRVIGALGLLKDDRAVPGLAKLADGATPELIHAAVLALADIGTPTARRYLSTIASSSVFEHVRELAREALGPAQE